MYLFIKGGAKFVEKNGGKTLTHDAAHMAN